MDYGTASSSLDPLPKDIRYGMIAMGIIGLISTISTSSLLSLITYRMVYWRKFYDQPIHTNQVFILIYNLLLADFQQAISFLLSFHWVSQNKLVGPSTVCFAQGWLIQIGDMSSGLWVLAIAVHTFINLVGQKTIPARHFIIAVVLLWIFCLLLTAIGPLMNRMDFFVPAGAWCWINESHEIDRLYLHYLWIFISQLGSLVIYISTFFFLQTRISNFNIFQNAGAPPATPKKSRKSTDFPKGKSSLTTTVVSNAPHDPFATSRRRILRTARYMVVYPFAYVALTLPLAAGRVSSMAGRSPPLVFFPVAGCFMACCGFVDVLLYIWTRKALLKSSVAPKAPEGGLTRFMTGDSRNRVSRAVDTSDGRDEIRMGSMDTRDLGETGKGRIFVSKTVVTTTTADDFSHDSGENISSERSDSLKSLVNKKDEEFDFEFKSWLT